MSAPTHKDLRKEWNSEPVAQTTENDCTAVALTGAVEYAVWRGRQLRTPLSIAFLYCRTPKKDGRFAIRKGLQTLAEQGICTRELWPDLTLDPPNIDSCVRDALSRKVHYKELDQRNRLAALRECIGIDNVPFVFSYWQYVILSENSDWRGLNDDWVLPLPSPESDRVNLHAVMAVGYCDDSRQFLVRDSEGPRWKFEGHFYMPYDFIENPERATDFYAITGLVDK